MAEFFVGKLAFVTLALVIPIMFHSWLAVIGVFALASFVQGLMLAVVFQLAHVMDEAEFPVPNEDNHRIESAWAIHQVQTTLNFAPRNRLVTWYTGGLNHQIEHHLFPQICHVNYPAISAVVKQTCDDFNVSYVSHRTIRGALASHYRCLRDLSRPTA